MKFRRSNLPLAYADKIYQSDNLIQTVETILNNSEVYKAVWFYKPQLIQSWKQEASRETAEAIGKLIIRMASRTTINQLFGVMGTENTKKKETYFLSTEYLRQLFINKIIELFDSEGIQYKLSNLLQERKHAFYINSYFQGIRKNLVFRKNTLMGQLLQYIAQNKSISGENMLQFGEQHEVSRNQMKTVVELLYNSGAIDTNIDIEALAFREKGWEEQAEMLLSKCEARQLQTLVSQEHTLTEADTSQFIVKIKNIEKTAHALLGDIFSGRVVNGYSKEDGSSIAAEAFGMSKALKRFFSTLGANSSDYIQMKAFEAEFVNKYGMFHCIPVVEILFLFQERRKDTLDSQELDAQKEWFREKLAEARQKEQDEIVLTGSDLDLLNGFDNGRPRVNPSQFDLKYRRYGKDIVLTNMTFSFPGTLFHAYLDREELYPEQDKEEADYLYYCPAYLASIGCPRGAQTGNRIRLNSQEKQELSLEQLGIMVDFDGMHVVDRKTYRRIIPINPTMKSFQYQIESVAMEFLDMMGKYLAKMPSSVLPMDHFEHPIVPRIRFKNIILQPKKWILKGRELMQEGLEANLMKRKVDRYVYQVMETGEERYLDLESQLGRKWLMGYAHNHTFVILTEAFHGEDYCMDRVIPIHFEAEKPLLCHGFCKEEPQKAEEQTPYSSWHISYVPENLKEIKEAIAAYTERYRKNYFFIHYVENRIPVLRLRIRDDELEQSREFMRELMMCGLIREFSLQNYVPETVRYGGRHYIHDFERLFEQESALCIKWDFPRRAQEMVCIQVAVILAMAANVLGEAEAGNFLQTHFGKIRGHADSLMYYRKYKDVLPEQVRPVYDRIKREFASIDRQITQYIAEIAEQDDVCYAEYVLLSLMHMRLNRMAGISKNLEAQSLELAYLLYKKALCKKGRKSSEVEYDHF